MNNFNGKGIQLRWGRISIAIVLMLGLFGGGKVLVEEFKEIKRLQRLINSGEC